MLYLLGFLGGFFFAYAAVPQAIRTVIAGRHLGTPLDITVAVLLGTVTMYTYLYVAHGFDLILTINYLIEGASWVILLYYRLFRNS